MADATTGIGDHRSKTRTPHALSQYRPAVSIYKPPRHKSLFLLNVA